jgi:Peptidase inhibitor family I36
MKLMSVVRYGAVVATGLAALTACSAIPGFTSPAPVVQQAPISQGPFGLNPQQPGAGAVQQAPNAAGPFAQQAPVQVGGGQGSTIEPLDSLGGFGGEPQSSNGGYSGWGNSSNGSGGSRGGDGYSRSGSGSENGSNGSGGRTVGEAGQFDIFNQANFQGGFAQVTGVTVDDLASVDLNDLVSSAVNNSDQQMCLYTDAHFSGSAIKFPPHTQIQQFDRTLNDRVSSVRPC